MISFYYRYYPRESMYFSSPIFPHFLAIFVNGIISTLLRHTVFMFSYLNLHTCFSLCSTFKYIKTHGQSFVFRSLVKKEWEQYSLNSCML